MISIVSGFIAGTLHVFAGPDHILAITPLSIEKNSLGTKIGFKWGIGHSLGVISLGVLTLIFKEAIKINLISTYSEKIVGATLILIGLFGIKKAISTKIHFHTHEHENIKHTHFHIHGKLKDEKNSHKHFHAAFGVGMLHGFAGTSHIFGIIPALTFNSQIDTILYLTFFSLGTILSMGIFSGIIGKISKNIFLNNNLFYKKLLFSFSIAAVLLGIFWVYNS